MISKKKIVSKKLKDCAFIVGYNSTGICIYNDFLTLSNYYDSDHIWDDNEKIKNLDLSYIHGYLFDENSNLFQEFQSHFDIDTGLFIQGWSKDEFGIIQEHN